MLTRRDKDILRVILTLSHAKTNPGLRRIGRLTSPPLCYEQVRKDIMRLVDRGLFRRSDRVHGAPLEYSLSREALAMLGVAGDEPRRLTLADLSGTALSLAESGQSCSNPEPPPSPVSEAKR